MSDIRLGCGVHSIWDFTEDPGGRLVVPCRCPGRLRVVKEARPPDDRQDGGGEARPLAGLHAPLPEPPEGVTIVPLEHPAAIHDAIAAALGENPAVNMCDPPTHELFLRQRRDHKR